MISSIDFPISELRLITVWHHHEGKRSSHSKVHYMHMSQVDTFVKATVKLHHEVGKLPTRSFPLEKLDNLWEIIENTLSLETITYWWASEDQIQDDPQGAQMNRDYTGYKRLWAHPDLLADEARRQAEEDEYD